MIVQNSLVAMQLDHHAVRRQQLTPMAPRISITGSDGAQTRETQMSPRDEPVPGLTLRGRQTEPLELYSSHLPASLRVMKLECVRSR
jgi:hypothetical protein